MHKNSNFRRGSVELLILYLLSQKDFYGYELSLAIRKYSDEYLNIPVGSLYPALYKLMENGYISGYKKNNGARQVYVYYHIEERGNARLQDLLQDYYATMEAIQKILAFKI